MSQKINTKDFVEHMNKTLPEGWKARKNKDGSISVVEEE